MTAYRSPAPSVLDRYTGPTRTRTPHQVAWPAEMAGCCDPQWLQEEKAAQAAHIANAAIDFDAALDIGTVIQACWTTSGRSYAALAKIIKLNDKSVIAILTEPTSGGRHQAGNLVTLPRYGNKIYTTNTGAYPAPSKPAPNLLT